MEKIIALLKKIGASDDLAKELTEEFQKYAGEIETKNREKFDKILEKAKALCVEYVEREVLSNARKVKVFLESKERELSDLSERSRKLEESEALVQLRQISAVLNGGKPDVNADSLREMAALKKTVERLEKQNASLKEDNKRHSSTANRANTLAERALSKAKEYRSRLSTAGLLGETSQRSERPAPKAAVSESRNNDRRVIGESRRPAERPSVSRPAGAATRSIQSSDPMINEIAKHLQE